MTSNEFERIKKLENDLYLTGNHKFEDRNKTLQFLMFNCLDKMRLKNSVIRKFKRMAFKSNCEGQVLFIGLNSVQDLDLKYHFIELTRNYERRSKVKHCP